MWRQLDEKRARERRQREEDKARRRQRVKRFEGECFGSGSKGM
jgi:hypothetical protein